MYGQLINKKASSKGVLWEGVRNYQAANNLKKMKKEIYVFFIILILERRLLGL